MVEASCSESDDVGRGLTAGNLGSICTASETLYLSQPLFSHFGHARFYILAQQLAHYISFLLLKFRLWWSRTDRV